MNIDYYDIIIKNDRSIFKATDDELEELAPTIKKTNLPFALFSLITFDNISFFKKNNILSVWYLLKNEDIKSLGTNYKRLVIDFNNNTIYFGANKILPYLGPSDLMKKVNQTLPSTSISDSTSIAKLL